MNPNIYKIKIDTILELKNEHFTVSANDVNSHKLNIEVTQNKEPYPLTGLSVNIHFLKSDGKLNEQEATIDNAIEGKATCILETNSINKQGRVRAEVLISKNGDLLTTKRFEFYATNPLASDKVIESTTEFPLFKQILQDEIERKEAELLRVENEVDRLALAKELQTLQEQLQGYLDNPEQFKGESFKYEDFTPEQIESLKIKGDKGDSFKYSDFTPEQLALLKGAKGDKISHVWDGTKLSLENPNGTFDTPVDLKGAKGDTGEVSLAQLNVVQNELTAHKEDYTQEHIAMNNKIIEIEKRIGIVHNVESWNDVVSILRKKQADKYFRVGDALVSYYNGIRHVVDIIGINHDVDEGDIGDTLTIQFRDCLLNGVFDAPEALYYASSIMSPGKKIFQLDSGKYEFTTTIEVPQDGQVVVRGWTDYVPSTATTYGADRTTVIESGIAVTSSGGTVNISPVNHQQRCRYGSNNYKESAVRQWLNNDKEIFVWVPQTNFDRSPSSYPASGFLKLIQPELASVIVATQKQVARNTITDGGGQDTFTDKVFLLSRVEVGLGGEGVTTGENVYEFWEGATDADRLKVLGVSPRYWYLRSPSVHNVLSVRGVNTTGGLSNYGAFDSTGLPPACKIS